jgi:hypothetical protein
MRSASKMSRRNFLMTSGAATVWASGGTRGYTSTEMRAKAASGDLTGVSKFDLDTPALCVDIDKLEQNIATIRKNLEAMKVASRPHAKTHKCPAIAKLQLAGGSIGICTAKVS